MSDASKDADIDSKIISYVYVGFNDGMKIEHHQLRGGYDKLCGVVAHDNASPLQDAAGSRGVVCKGWTIV